MNELHAEKSMLMLMGVTIILMPSALWLPSLMHSSHINAQLRSKIQPTQLTPFMQSIILNNAAGFEATGLKPNPSRRSTTPHQLGPWDTTTIG